MKNEQLKTIMNGALILSLASFIAKILSAVYRVPFQNMVGNTGFYVYQQVYPIYGIGMTFALSGFPVFFSKMIAEAEQPLQQKRLFKQSLVILSVFATVLFAGVYGFSGRLAVWMGDEALTPIIRSVAWMFLCIPVQATLRGYFQGTYKMKPTAISQVTEQLVRVAVILLAAYWFTQTEMNLYQMGAGAMSGAGWGAFVSTLVLVIIYWKEKRNTAESNENLDLNQSSIWSLARRYMTEGLTICLLTSMLVLFQLIDSFTLYKGLVENGIATETAKSLKGIYDRGQPLVQLGMIVGTGFAASFIPLMSQAYMNQQKDQFHRSAKSLIRMTAIFATAAVAGLLAILPEVNHMLFGDTRGSDVLSVYIVSIAAASLVMGYHAILQSLNQYRLTLYALGLGLVVKWLANGILVTHLDTLGSSAATLLGLLVMGVFLAGRIPLAMRTVWKHDHFWLKLAGSAIVLFVSAFTTKQVLLAIIFTDGGRTSATLVALLTVGVGVIVFGTYVIAMKLITIREWVSLPFGKKILRKLSK